MALITTKQEKQEVLTWLSALESGEFPQGRGKLQTHVGYCCLGVGCVVTVPKEKLLKEDNDIIVGFTPSAQENAPAWLVNISQYIRSTFNYSVMDANDNGTPFKEISTKVRELLKHELDAIPD